MATKKLNQDGIFQNNAAYFKHYQGTILPSENIKYFDFSDLNIAVIGMNQMVATHLDLICQKAQFVKVFQMSPHFVLPHTERGINRLISHPLIIKNRRLFNQRVKSLLAIRYLDSQVQDNWLKRQLMPNSAADKKVFFKSDTYYTALQRDNCKLITWPIVKINQNAIQSMEGVEHIVDVIISTYDQD
ncbi:flavoprotein [Acinetobacter shaoyimingii]|uniref:Flavoprotein n=2 Tax=Acinetobacter shaoyimingii TaxID=2715164 RepID=A0A6G8RWI7_9GAMM|nr:flavoprotein [Acinetobacter shaoyimingii]NHB57153.1 flavoprotein [Acinetobacter shaoyimingii]QIO06235.1 flavoprotein [Acinetobacter shaoyimingii]